MAASFSRTLRSIRADRPTRQLLAIAIAVALLGSWIAWMVLARVAVVEATPSARLEVEQASHPVQAPVAGRIARNELRLGREVQVGDVLVELDASAQQLDLAQAKARLAAIGPELGAVRKELDAHVQALVDDSEGVGATVAEARAKYDASKVAVRLAEEQLARAERLRGEGLASESELEKARAEVAQKRAASAADLSAIGRTGASGRAELSDRRARRESLAREAATLEGEELTVRAQISRLEHDVGLRVVRASVAGRVAEVGTHTVGSVVEEGASLGTILPAGELRIVADYAPPRALGRIHPGMPARMRLEGFSWAQHGTLPARVKRLASEVRDGRIRAELEVLPSESQVPLQHGLPGTVEVEIERVAPYLLVLRAAGAWIEGNPRDADPSPASSGTRP